jgi:quinol monooxygenase YgiN
MIGVYLQLGPMTEEQYHAVDSAVQAAGVSEEGCMLHTCFKEGENLAVFDVWESKEAYEAFMSQLGPIAAGFGITELPTTMYVDMVAYEPR